MKKDGGIVNEDSPKWFLQHLKKFINDDCLESLNTKNLGELCNSLKLKASRTKSELLQILFPFKDDPALLDNLCQEELLGDSPFEMEIPLPTAGSKCNTSLFPKISKEVIKRYPPDYRLFYGW